MRARVGDLAIVRFDLDGHTKNKYDEQVGIVTRTVTYGYVERCGGAKRTREYEFIYWNKVGSKIEVNTRTLPPHRLVRARPVNDDWEGTLYSLTLDQVMPVTPI
jgi:hypothetical protein